MDDMSPYYPPPPPPATLLHHHHHDPYTQYHHHHHPPPPLPPPSSSQPAYYPTYSTPYPPPHSSDDQLRTLFVAGLPPDVKAREIYNLFREFPGYESSHLRNNSGKQPFGFAVFLDQQSAITAMQALNGMVFDLESGSTLHVDFAKSNSRSKRSRIDDANSESSKRFRRSESFPRAIPDSGVGSVHVPGIGNSAYNTVGYPSAQRPASEATFAKSNDSSAPPCPTLFVANLGKRCSEQELIQVFSSCRGYLKLKMQGSYGAPVAFVDFQDTASSSEARDLLQGTILYTSPPGEGMRLEFAKSRMGMRSKNTR